MDKLLSHNEPEFVANKAQLKLMKFIFDQEQRKIDANQRHNLIKRCCKSAKEHKKRKKPQWLTSYYKEENMLIVWIYGTDKSHFDWLNCLNTQQKEIKLNEQFHNKTIAVHHGMYNAINTQLFYTQLFTDIKFHLMDKTKNIKKVIFSGHSQGGGIAQLMYILWRTQYQCEFVTYFRYLLRMNKLTNFNASGVYTIGSLHCIGHDHQFFVDKLFGKDIVNIINERDPIPMMFGGDKIPRAISKSKKHGFAKWAGDAYIKSVMENFPKIASFGPIGQFIVIINCNKNKKDKHVRPLLRHHIATFEIYKNHLMHGAATYISKKKQWTDVPTLLDLKNHHLGAQYRKNLGVVWKKYLHPKIPNHSNKVGK